MQQQYQSRNPAQLPPYVPDCSRYADFMFHFYSVTVHGTEDYVVSFCVQTINPSVTDVCFAA
jgi:hypothetical protein